MTAKLKIDDLSLNQELDHEALSQVCGGTRSGGTASVVPGTTALAQHVQRRFSQIGSQRRFAASKFEP